MPEQRQPSLWSEIKAMAREAIKDIREVVVEQGWFGQRGGPGEPGTPLNPMYAEVAQDRGLLEGQQSIGMEGPQQSYQDQLREAAARQVPDRGNEMER
jgi:hypothetical protein